MKKLSYKTLYIAWAVMFALTAVLGFAFPNAMGGGLIALRLTAILFFLPPVWVLVRAKREENRFHVLLVRWLSLASIGMTGVLLALNFTSVLWSQAVGTALYAALVVVSAPMMCANHYALSLFLWGMLLAGTFYQKK